MPTFQIVEKQYGTTGEVWSDLYHEIIAGSDGSIRKVINIDAVISSIDNILRTAPFERVMRPDFASRLKHLVFEPTSTRLMNRIVREIKEKIPKWDNRVIVNAIDFFGTPDSNLLKIQLSFSVKGYDNVFKHSISFEAGT